MSVIKKLWDNFIDEFKVRNLLETTSSRLGGIKNDIFFIRLGHCILNPSKIWQKKIPSSCKLVTRDTSSFVSKKLIAV